MRRLFNRFRSTPKLHGHIDYVDQTHIVGWAAYSGGIAPHLIIKVDGRTIGETIPNIERADLKRLFPNNIRLGFVHRFKRSLTGDERILVMDEHRSCLSNSPYRCARPWKRVFRYRIPNTEWIENQKRAVLAAHYLKGNGIEIGALHEPLILPKNVGVKYVDRLARDDLRKQYPELVDCDLVEPDIICNGETLDRIPDNSVGFVIANHFIEHTQDPIATLKTFVRVLERDGIIFMAVPDKQWSFDRDREITEFSHLQRDHEQGPDGSLNQHFIEWARDVEKCPDSVIATRVQQLKELNYSIHFHVWDALSFLSFLSDAKSHYHLPIQLCTAIAGRDELVVILRKAA